MKRAIIVTGLGYGDEGKGSTVDWLGQIMDVDLVVLYCGGYQAGHRVVSNDGRSHVFSQLGSATMHGARTFISENRVISPYALKNELWALANVMGGTTVYWLRKKLTIHPKALVATPFHVHLNRARERARSPEGRHGSCGRGIWETRVHAAAYPENAIRAEDLAHEAILKRKLLMIHDYAYGICVREDLPIPSTSEAAALEHIACYNWNIGEMPEADTVVFEGSQGIMLDPDVGTMPHVTGSSVLPDLARRMISKGVKTVTLGVTRRYPTRHGAGPFVSEMGIEGFVDPSNPYNEWQGQIRVGVPNFDELHRAATIAEVDGIVVNHCDMVTTQYLKYYKGGKFQAAEGTDEMFSLFTCAKIIVAKGHGPKAEDKRTNYDGMCMLINS